MTLLQDITTAALLGTERQAISPPPVPGPLGEMLARLPADPEAGLLGTAALASLYQRAGTLPATTTLDRPVPCPPDDQPVCSERVAQGLAVMLGGAHKGALPEMLAALAAAGRRVPEPLLPELLKLGRQDRSLRDFLLPVLGRRGRWLGAQNREWAFADQLVLEMAESAEQVWAEGNREARLTTLTRLRETDPAAGLTLLQTTWATETADDRAAFLGALVTGLSLADEPFLEAALDDRGKDVRRAAADLLARLPDSQFSRRMIARAEPLLVGKRSLLGAFSLEVALPAEHDKGMERDGISEKQSERGTGLLGDKAWWLCQIVGAVPLPHWTEVWKRDPGDILEAAGKTEWGVALQRGWEAAFVRRPDADWLGPLLRAGQDQSDWHRRLHVLRPSLSTLPNARMEALVMEALRPQRHLFGTDAPVPLHDTHSASVLLEGSDQPWSADLSRAILESIRERVRIGASQEHRVWQTGSLLRQYAYRVPPALAGEAARGWPENSTHWAFWQPHVHEFLATLHFRHDLLHDISQDSSQETRP